MTRDVIEACPDCDSAYLYRRRHKNRSHEHDWRCEGCGETFDDPNTRPPDARRCGSERSSKLVADLLDADPNEVGP